MTPPSHVHHVAVAVSDLGQAEHFYVGKLGLNVIRRHHRDDGTHRATWLDLGGAFLALELVSGGPQRTDDAVGWHCVALGIPRDSRDAWMSHLETQGVPIERTSDYTLYVRDPDGSLVALSHYPDR